MTKIQRTLQGVIVSRSGEQTLKVKVERKQPHPLYKKVVRSHRNYLVHCTNMDRYEVGDRVIIGVIRPVSKAKSWQILSKVELVTKKSK